MADEIPDRLKMADEVREALDDLNAVLDEADHGKLEDPATEGGWARRDALAHMVYWHEICIWALKATMDGTYAPVDLSDVDSSNLKAVEDMKVLSTQQLIDDFRRTGSEIVDTMLQVPEELWNAKPRLFKWVDGTTIRHYPEHRDQMAAAKAD